MNFREHIKKILITTFFAFVFVGIIILIKLLGLKTFDRKNFSQIIPIEKNYYEGKRGDILSVNHKILSTSIIRYDIKFDPLTDYLQSHKEYFDNNLPKLADSLSNYLQKATPSYYITQIKTGRRKGLRYIPLVEGITYTQKQKIEKFPFFELGKIRGGGIFEKKYYRFHPFSPLADITIGIYAEKRGNKILKGLEYSYNSILQGNKGVALYKKGPLEKKILHKVIIEPKDGADILTTLDMNMQYFLETALKKRVEELKAQRGVGIIMDVKTGEIRAMANLTYDSTTNKYQEIYNSAVQWLYAPGSVVKPFSMIALFEEYPNIPLNKIVATGNGRLKVKDFTITDDKKGGFGTITLQQVVEKSSNVGVVKTILTYFGNKPGKFIKRLREIGLDKKTGIDLDGESIQGLKDPTSKDWWYEVSLGQIAIGYEHKMTPIQILALYNAIANDGKYITPHLVKAIIKNGREKPNPQLKLTTRIIASKRTIAKVKKMLEGVVQNGTASKTVKSNIISIAGKTGTAKIYEQGKFYQGNKYNTTFVGYFPADKPKYSMIIVISDPKKDRSGAKAAGPVFRKVAEQIYNYDPTLHNINKDIVNYWAEDNTVPKIQSGYKPKILYLLQTFELPYTDHSHKSNWVSVISMETKEDLIPFNFKSKKKPNVKTMAPMDAAWILENQGYNLIFKGAGKVVNQNFYSQNVKLFLK